MTNTAHTSFLEAFLSGDVHGAVQLLPKIDPHDDVTSHPLLRECVSHQHGHCYSGDHLRIAELLLPVDVRRFRDHVLADRLHDVNTELLIQPRLVHAEFTAGRGIAQAIHHWQSIPVAEALLSAGADINALTTVHAGDTPLMLMVRSGRLNDVEFLLKRGADPNLGAAMHLPSGEMEKAIELLLEYGWDIRRGSQLLHDANHGHGRRIATWLEYGVDPNQADEQGRTALHLLAIRGSGRNAIRALIEAGADVNRQDHDGLTPLDHARGARRDVATRLLEELGARPAT